MQVRSCCFANLNATLWQLYALPLIGSCSGEELITMPQNRSLDPGQYLLGLLTKISEKRQI